MITAGQFIITQERERLLCIAARDTGWGDFRETETGPIYTLPLDGLRVARDQRTPLPRA
ncbi:MAG: hypothetical protein ACOYLS_01380 [Polymorphobacter sp.]